MERPVTSQAFVLHLYLLNSEHFRSLLGFVPAEELFN